MLILDIVYAILFKIVDTPITRDETLFKYFDLLVQRKLSYSLTLNKVDSCFKSYQHCIYIECIQTMARNKKILNMNSSLNAYKMFLHCEMTRTVI